MKKLLLLFLVAVGGVFTANAQRETSGTIRVAFTDPTNKWTQSNFYIYVYGTSTSNDDSWPGVDVTQNVITIDGQTYYYRDFPIETYGTGFDVIAVNDNGSSHENQSQSENLTWCYDRTTITGDTYYSLKSEWDNSGHRKAELKEVYYIADYDNSGKVLLATQNGTKYSVSFNSSDFPKFVVANSYAFKDDGTLDFTKDNNYPANIYRPNYEKVLGLTNLNENVSDSQRSEFYRWHNAGYFNASTLNDVTLDMTFTISNWLPTNYTISPYITKTISAAGYATIASEGCLNFDGVSGLVGQIGTMTGNTVNFTNVNDVPANTGVLLKGAAGEYKIGFVNSSSTDVSNNVLVGVTAETQIADMTEGKTNFVLMNGNSGVGFYKVSAAGFTVGANTAYLSTAISETAKSFIAVEGGETTGISTIDNGQLTMENVYDLQGRKVMNPTKGLYIVNGKKYIIK